MSEPQYRTTPDNSSGMPKGIPYIVGNEAAERFSFYGMRGILYLFLTEHLLNASGDLAVMEENEANYWYHSFVAGAYLTPIVGAVLSDWLWGKYRTIIILSLVYCLGHAVMALVDFPLVTHIAPRTALFMALSLIAIGTGGIKPCVSSHVGDQFGTKNKHLIPAVFSIFYFSINLGSMASYIIIPRLLDSYGPGVAFGVPGVLMALATLVFWMGRKVFVHVPATGSKMWTDIVSPAGRSAILNLVPLYIFVAAFWMLFDQTSSAWVEQAKHLDRNMFGYELNPAESQATNPLLVMLMIPLFSFVIYPVVGRFWEFTPLRRIGAGLLVTPISFAIAALLQRGIDAGQSPHISWQLLAYVVMTAAEILVSITALEFSYTQAPRTLKSFVMGLFFLSVFLGNMATAQVNHYVQAQKDAGNPVLDGENYYWFFTWAMLATAVAYVVWSQFYRGKTYIQGEEELDAVATAEGVNE
ncbi:Di-/tripeptide transporter [Posidoniimonas corsicana]|uniref:Di-/tripeptide transporter n=1 Tax=Posidoniimonas corsicana TaxID=1938618 RepID=A0A5C5VIA3_9BACT|nr:POT family MFS transporter [Posidoniimonas corsicana]TWT37599.1 Di-/tripeptide transporter [Posidoniimonas corsicana]